MLQEAKQRDDTLVHAAMNAAPWKPDAEKRPRWYTHKVSHLGQQTGELPTSRRFRFQRWENSVTVHAARGWAHPLQTLQYPICFDLGSAFEVAAYQTLQVGRVVSSSCRWREAERRHATSRERMGSLTLHTLALLSRWRLTFAGACPERAGMFTHYQYSAEIGSDVLLLDEHVTVESLVCEAVGRSAPPAPPAPSDGHSTDLALLRGSAMFTKPMDQVSQTSASRCVCGCPQPRARVWKAATSKAEPRQKQDWILECLQGG